MKVDEAIGVFDKSAERTRPNAQTEAWAVIRDELTSLQAFRDNVLTVASEMSDDATAYGQPMYMEFNGDDVLCWARRLVPVDTDIT